MRHMDMRKSGIILGLAVATPGLCAAQSAGPAETGGCIALERGDGDSPVIKARVNNAGPFAFVLDTASSATTLDSARVALLSMQPDVETERAEGMSGAIDVRLYRLGRFEAGPVLRRGMTVPGVRAPSFRSHDIAGSPASISLENISRSGAGTDPVSRWRTVALRPSAKTGDKHRRAG